MRIATFNAGLLDFKLGKRTLFEFTPYTRQRAVLVAEQLAKLSKTVNILCVQEIYHSVDQHLIKEALTAALPFSFAPPAMRSLRLNSGLMIFSKYKITDCIHHYFRNQSIDEFLFSQKGFIAATIHLETGEKIKLINTHLSSGGLLAHPESARATKLRSKQLAELVRLAPENDILAGDLNCGLEVAKKNFQEFVEIGYFDLVSLSACGSDSPFMTWEPNNPLNKASPHSSSPPQRIDHILAREPLVPRQRPRNVSRVLDESILIANGVSVTPSDHYGIFIEL